MMVEPQAQDAAPLLLFAGTSFGSGQLRGAPAASSAHVLHVPVTSQSQGQATTGKSQQHMPGLLAQLPRSN